MTKQDVINLISLKLPDNTSRQITPNNLRECLNEILEYAQGLELGETTTDLNDIYRRKDDSYSSIQVDNKLSIITSKFSEITSVRFVPILPTPTEASTLYCVISGGKFRTVITNENNLIINEDSITISQLNQKEPTITAGATNQYWNGNKMFVDLNKAAVGLGNVDNTSDVNKPISNPTQTALNGKTSFADVNDLIAVAVSKIIRVTAYDNDITGIRDGSNNMLVLKHDKIYKSGTLSIWRDGFRLSKGGESDYIENGPRTGAIFNRPPLPIHKYIFEYEPAI